LPRNRNAENVRLRVGPNPLATLITSNLTKVRSRFSCNMRTPKAYVVTTTTHIGIKRDPAKLPGERATANHSKRDYPDTRILAAAVDDPQLPWNKSA
jgi:hypothetical protein